MASSFKAVVLAGGRGTRLWPLSTYAHPKQFLEVEGGMTLLQRTINRLNLEPAEKYLVVCGKTHVQTVVRQLSRVGGLPEIIVEPSARNTCPAIALAAHFSDSEEILLVVPTDHFIEDERVFLDQVSTAVELAELGNIVTFGVRPTFPSSQYGYIKIGSPHGPSYRVDKFTEKPNEQLAQVFLSKGEYLWNSGVFCFKAKVFLKELELFSKNTNENIRRALEHSKRTNALIVPNEDYFGLVKGVSVDREILEKSSRVCVLPLETGWDDLGDLGAFARRYPSDENGNSKHESTYHVDNFNTVVVSDNSRKTLAVNLRDITVIDAEDLLIVAQSESLQRLPELLQKFTETPEIVRRTIFDDRDRASVLTSEERHSGCLITTIDIDAGAQLAEIQEFSGTLAVVVLLGLIRIINGTQELQLAKHESRSFVVENGFTILNVSSEVSTVVVVSGESEIVQNQ